MSDSITGSTAVIPGQLGHYDVVEKIGQGGMAIVYRGIQPSLNRPVAIKVLPPQFATTTELLARFDREAEIVSQLAHSNIVQVIDRGRQDNLLYIVMEYVEGDSLDKLIRGGKLTVSQVIHYASQICDGIDYAHKAGVIHRDLKPANILIDRRTDRVKIADFGIAALEETRGALATLTAERSVIGTMNYMSPEQRVDSHAVTSATDVFSFGVILYEMITGKLPVGHYKAPSLIRPDIPLGLDTIVNRCLAESPSDRYASAGEVRDELQRLTIRHTAPKSFSALGRLNKRQQWYALGGAAAGVLLLLVVVAAIVGHFRKAVPPPPVVVASPSAPAVKQPSAEELRAQAQRREEEIQARAQDMRIQADYDRAQGLMREAKWAEAITILTGLVQQHPQSSLAPESQFAIATACVELADRERSILEFNRVIRNYPQSPRVPDAVIRKCRAEREGSRQQRLFGGPTWDAKLQQRLLAEVQDVLAKQPTGAHAAPALELIADIAEPPALSDAKTAADALMKRYALAPDGAADFLYRAADLYDRRAKDPAAAAAAYDKFVKDFPSDKRTPRARSRLEQLQRSPQP